MDWEGRGVLWTRGKDYFAPAFLQCLQNCKKCLKNKNGLANKYLETHLFIYFLTANEIHFNCGEKYCWYRRH